MDILFSLRQMQLFTAIVRCGGASAAANELGMSQSAASTALIELENRYQRPLFERVGKRLRVSETGRALLPVALDMLDRAAKADAILRGRSGPGPLRIGATQTIGTYVAPNLIARYSERHPHSGVTLDISNTATIASRVQDFTLDLGMIEGEYTGTQLLISDWLDDEMVLICNAAHQLTSRKSCSIDDVLAERWVLRERGSGSRQALDQAMVPYWSRWQVSLELQQTEAIVQIVAASALIGCVSRLAVQAPLALGLIKILNVSALNLRRRFYIIRHRDKYETEGMTEMLTLSSELATCSC
jgi:DNA-binding transcriptional LysR family regulator